MEQSSTSDLPGLRLSVNVKPCSYCVHGEQKLTSAVPETKTTNKWCFLRVCGEEKETLPLSSLNHTPMFRYKYM